jgi:pimeloyl-ACP methyl ester carboxylesterase
MNEQFAAIGDDITLCYETFGERTSPPVLLVMGLATQMIAWHEEFCEQLAARGFFVIRYDNRDIGRSTRLDGFPPPTPLELLTRRIKNPPYTLSDMARDGVRLLDALGIEEAHVVGASMGGMIAQVIAAEHPDRVLSLVSIMSMTGSRWKGQPALKVYPMLLAKPPKTKEESVSRLLKLFRVVGSPGFDRDEDELARQGALAWDRGPATAGAGRQLGAIVASGDRTAAVTRVRAPTLVIHGTRDKLVNVSGGKATAKAIRGSELLLVDGMGHDLPRGVWDRVIDGIVRNAGRAGADARVAA